MRHALCFPDSPVGYEAEHRVLPCFLRLFVVFLASHAEQCPQTGPVLPVTYKAGFSWRALQFSWKLLRDPSTVNILP